LLKKTMTIKPLHILALAVLAGSASAQSMNLDIGMNLILWPAPSSSYAAAAAQPGHWNALIPPYSQGLADLSGGLTAVTVSTTGGMGAYNDPFTGVFGDDEAFMADQCVIPNLGVTGTIDFAGLSNGLYTVYTYAWEGGGTASLIDVPAGAGGQQSIGGAWTGSPHQPGITYALHSVTVTDGTLSIEATGPDFNSGAGVNGVQLVFGDNDIGTNYCVATINSSGFAAPISANGLASVAASNLSLSCEPVPNQPGLFYYGPNQNQLAFGNGFRCVGGTVGRLPVVTATGGAMQVQVDLASPPSASTQILAGSTWHFQAWYRDPVAGGAFFNLSDGISIDFQP
jgi:hypothetical protein